MTRRHFTVTILVWALLALRDATPSLADDTGKLIGTWKLVSAVSEELATGQTTNIYKGTPIGFITYGADGRVMTLSLARRVRSHQGQLRRRSRQRRYFDQWPLMRAPTLLRGIK
jgi:hypothetical protein